MSCSIVFGRHTGTSHPPRHAVGVVDMIILGAFRCSAP